MMQKQDKYIIVNCPHCKYLIVLYNNDINCSIFRHGIYKNNFTQINPHETKEKCDFLYNNGLIYGCSKPFKLHTQNNNIFEALECEYI
jgi:hypothetical protein